MCSTLHVDARTDRRMTSKYSESDSEADVSIWYFDVICLLVLEAPHEVKHTYYLSYLLCHFFVHTCFLVQ